MARITIKLTHFQSLSAFLEDAGGVVGGATGGGATGGGAELAAGAGVWRGEAPCWRRPWSLLKPVGVEPVGVELVGATPASFTASAMGEDAGIGAVAVLGAGAGGASTTGAVGAEAAVCGARSGVGARVGRNPK